MIIKIAIVLPTINEEKGIAKVLDKIYSMSKNLGKNKWQIIIVDGGSTDNTLKIAGEKKASMIFRIKEKGKARAIKEVFRKINADYIIIMDADASYRVEDVPRLLKSLKDCDVVIGSRFKGKIEKSAMSLLNNFGNCFLTFLASSLYGKLTNGARVSDVCSGMWGFRKVAYKKIKISAQGFELEANFFVESVKYGFTICEVPITYKKRVGINKLRVIDGIAIAYFLIKNKF